MDLVTEILGTIGNKIDFNTPLPWNALGFIGCDLMSKYDAARHTEIQNVNDGVAVGRDLADNMRRTRQNYAQADTVTVQTLQALQAKLKAAQAGGPPNVGPDKESGGAFLKSYLTNPLLDSALIAGGGAVAHLIALDRGYTVTNVIGKLNTSVMGQVDLSTSAMMGMIAKMTFSAMILELVWESVRVPSDEDINRAISAWAGVAQDAGQIFGTDVPGIREDLQNAWKAWGTDSAAKTADAVLGAYVTAGVEFADRATQRAAALNQLVGQLNEIHRIVAVVCGVAFAAIVGALIAAVFEPLSPAGAAEQIFISQMSTFLLWVVGISAAIFELVTIFVLGSEGGKFTSSPQDKGLPPVTFTSLRKPTGK